MTDAENEQKELEIQVREQEKKLGEFTKLIKINEDKLKEIVKIQTASLNLMPDLSYAFKPIIDSQKYLESVSKNIAETYKSLFNAFSAIDLKPAEIFNKNFDWLDFLTLSMALELGEVLEKEGREKVFEKLNEFICKEEFEKYLDEKIDCNVLFKKRKEIILRGYSAHKSKDFITSVSILLPQIEGIIWDIGIHKKVVSPEYNSCKIIACDGKVIKKVAGGKDAEWDLASLILHLFGNEDAQAKFYQNIFYKEVRSPSLHGRTTDFSLISSVTALLLVFGLIEKIRMEETNNETTK